MVTALVVLIALGILGWGLIRARPYGQVGILAWLQSVVLMAPWLLFFSLFAIGIYLNLVTVLFLFIFSTGLYIYIGNRLRAAGQDAVLSQKASPLTGPSAPVEARENEASSTAPNGTMPVTPAPIAAIPEADLQAIKGLFGIETFFATETIPYQQGVIFKGNLRGEPETSHDRLSIGLKERLGDKYRLFLVENPDGKPVVIVLPSSADPRPSSLFQKLFAGVLAIATLVTCLEAGGLLLGFDFFSAPDRYPEVLPIALGILAVLTAHELGHLFMARRHQIRLSFPFFLPALQIGSFGALTRFESLLPSRKVLFDIAFAGPAVGGLISLGMLLMGLVLSHKGSLFQIPSEFFQGSILIGTLARVALGHELQNPIVDVHPLLVIGWLGLVITAINLMPAGQLDGGRIVQAIYGRKVAGRATFATLIVLGIAALVNPLALYWAVIILVLQRDLERPSLNELSEPDDARAALGLLALFLMITTLLPLTPSLAGRLGIGTPSLF
ncbi:site-2 protease family protein [Leptolyngbya sp. 'hensonii']|nr:site-2 protease family protein [Leptolyngbya sp. 'hensonii']